MDLRALKLLRCPVSGGELEPRALEVVDRPGRELIKTGLLLCRASGYWYPIINHVPVMLTFPTPLTTRFALEQREALRDLTDYRAPDLVPMPGERSVQQTFTEEWEGLGADEVTFVYTDEELLALHREVWLHAPGEGDPRVGSVLDVGCGFGREASILCRIFPNAEVFGVDLNLSVLEAAPELLHNDRLHLVIASLFHLPFAQRSLDHVHSQGVIHHTYSTERAFDAIAKLPAPDGSLFVWVYAFDDALTGKGVNGLLVFVYYLVSHWLGRPLLSRLPAALRNAAVLALTAALHPVLKARSRHAGRWRFRNSLHSVRDAWTPRYAHLHRFNDVLEWFQSRGFDTRAQDVSRYRSLTGKSIMGIGILGRPRGRTAGCRAQPDVVES